VPREFYDLLIEKHDELHPARGART